DLVRPPSQSTDHSALLVAAGSEVVHGAPERMRGRSRVSTWNAHAAVHDDAGASRDGRRKAATWREIFTVSPWSRGVTGVSDLDSPPPVVPLPIPSADRVLELSQRVFPGTTSGAEN